MVDLIFATEQLLSLFILLNQIQQLDVLFYLSHMYTLVLIICNPNVFFIFQLINNGAISLPTHALHASSGTRF